jgi:4-diphosphocytidyl-2-C-methyl-D-erythritol kinase
VDAAAVSETARRHPRTTAEKPAKKFAKTSAALAVFAPAKLNLFLHVTGRRDDGYHTLESVMVLLDFGDTLRVAPRDDAEIELTQPLPGVAREDDLAWRAARLLQQHAGIRRGATIALDKRIPIGAGMGGGSSDAASVLLALNRLWNAGLDRADLMRLGLALGADVPFFVFGANAHATGIGEVLREVSVPRLSFVIEVPPVQCATREIFGASELRRDTPASAASAFEPTFGRNDLEPVAVARHPAIGTALRALDAVEFGDADRAAIGAARMTGSGSASFRIVDRAFPASEAAWRAAGTRERGAWKTLQRIHYRSPKLHAANGAPRAGAKLSHARVIPAHPLRDFAAK